MSVKLLYLRSNLEFFRPNLGYVSEERGERLRQDIEAIEKRYQGFWDAALMGDYIWGLLRADESLHKRGAHVLFTFKCMISVRMSYVNAYP
jgi:hypothetical protein